jgi:hypothetical protein
MRLPLNPAGKNSLEQTGNMGKGSKGNNNAAPKSWGKKNVEKRNDQKWYNAKKQKQKRPQGKN